MNNRKRKMLKEANEFMDKASSVISMVLDDERSCLSNIPENLQTDEKYEKMEDICDTLDDIINDINEIQQSITDVSL